MEPLDLLPTALFSPSKAAQQRAQAQEWHSVDTWLSAKYQGRSVPTFERNDDTLKALLALLATNEKADEERDLLWSLQKEALTELEASKESGSNTALTASLVRGLGSDGSATLDTLASAAVALDVANPSLFNLASAASVRTQASQALAQRLQHLTQLQKELEFELQFLRAQLVDLRSPGYQPPLSLQRQTLEWNRNTKQLRTKLTEYSDRLASMQPEDSTSHEASEIVQQEVVITQLESKIEHLDGQVSAYQGLPSDKDQAIAQVKELEVQVAKLRRKLDSMFEGLVEKG